MTDDRIVREWANAEATRLHEERASHSEGTVHPALFRALLLGYEKATKGPAFVPMLLWCPGCNARHIDVGEFAMKLHHTHACQSCGMCWRPAVVNTVGVQFLPGFKNAVCPDCNGVGWISRPTSFGSAANACGTCNPDGLKPMAHAASKAPPGVIFTDASTKPTGSP